MRTNLSLAKIRRFFENIKSESLESEPLPHLESLAGNTATDSFQKFYQRCPLGPEAIDLAESGLIREFGKSRSTAGIQRMLAHQKLILKRGGHQTLYANMSFGNLFPFARNQRKKSSAPSYLSIPQIAYLIVFTNTFTYATMPNLVILRGVSCSI